MMVEATQEDILILEFYAHNLVAYLCEIRRS